MQEACKPLKELMDKTDRVRITGKDTDLTFSIKGIGAVPCAGENNIPDGEIFTAPVRDSVNGVITYNTTAYYDGIAFEHICFRFENGKIVEATSSDTVRLNQILDREESCRYIGEFAIGVNPYVTAPMKDSMFNEKMTGSIHFTPGNSISSADNGNRAPIHWDIVLAQTPEYGGGEIWFDDVLIRKDGRFVLPELYGLNPENLR
jgi:aminopeptidase